LKFSNVQILRAAAALLVVAFHVASTWGPQGFFKTTENPFNSLLFGHAGVELFFVLSGFIICHSTRNDPATLCSMRTFGGRRIWRIYPLVFVAVILATISRFAAHLPVNAADISTSLTLIPLLGGDYYPIVLWSLSHEMLFYLSFMLFYLQRNYFRTIIYALGIMSAFASFFFPATDAQNSILSLFASPYNLLFCFGMITQDLFARNYFTKNGFVLTAAGLGLFALTAWVEVGIFRQSRGLEYLVFARQLLIIPYGLAASLILAGFLALPPRSDRIGRWLVVIGDASYSIYLFHLFAIQFESRILLKFDLTSPTVAFPLLVTSAVGVGLLFWKIIELPLNKSRGAPLSHPKTI
jgi:exopolysaccharide production protein ExoZ